MRNFTGQIGIAITIRKKQGSDIDVACGQLRRGYQNIEKMI